MDSILSALVQADPENLDLKVDLARGRNTLGDLYMNYLGDTAKARDYYEQALTIRREWAKRIPDDDRAKGAVASELGLLANIRLQLGDPVGALRLYREELQWRGRYSKAEASLFEVRREEAGLFSKMGDVLVKLNEPKEAQNYYQKAAAIREELVRQRPDHSKARADVAISLADAGELKLLRWNDPAAALATIRRCSRSRKTS